MNNGIERMAKMYDEVNWLEYDAVELAKYIITKCTRDTKLVSNLQLNKILYFLFEDVAREYKKILFSNKIIAVNHGPIILDVYNKFASNGIFEIINEYEVDMRWCNDEFKVFLEKRIEKLQDEPIWDLVCRSHNNNIPWEKAISTGRYMPEIDKSYILKFVNQ